MTEQGVRNVVEGCGGLKVMDVSQCRNLEGSVWGRHHSVDSSAAGFNGNGDVTMSGASPSAAAAATPGSFLDDLSDGGRVKFVCVADGRFRGEKP